MRASPSSVKLVSRATPRVHGLVAAGLCHGPDWLLHGGPARCNNGRIPRKSPARQQVGQQRRHRMTPRSAAETLSANAAQELAGALAAQFAHVRETIGSF